MARHCFANILPVESHALQALVLGAVGSVLTLVVDDFAQSTAILQNAVRFAESNHDLILDGGMLCDIGRSAFSFKDAPDTDAEWPLVNRENIYSKRDVRTPSYWVTEVLSVSHRLDLLDVSGIFYNFVLCLWPGPQATEISGMKPPPPHPHRPGISLAWDHPGP